MAITLQPETAERARESIKRYVAEHLDQDIGDLEGSYDEPEFQLWK